ncbi:hypothetical protein GW17_00018578 [Ensete ventricosum]|nr:hypothetical protein GW17_00018578 [Ensete ventricosum]
MAGLCVLERLRGVKGLGKLKRRSDTRTSWLLGFWTRCADEPRDLQADLGQETAPPSSSTVPVNGTDNRGYSLLCDWRDPWLGMSGLVRW